MRNKGIGPIAVKIAIRRFSELHNVEYFIVRISNKNSHSIHIFEKMGASFIREEESEYVQLMRKLTEYAHRKDISDIEDGLKENIPDMKDYENEIVRVYKLQI